MQWRKTCFPHVIFCDHSQTLLKELTSEGVPLYCLNAVLLRNQYHYFTVIIWYCTYTSMNKTSISTKTSRTDWEILSVLYFLNSYEFKTSWVFENVWEKRELFTLQPFVEIIDKPGRIVTNLVIQKWKFQWLQINVAKLRFKEITYYTYTGITWCI